MVRSVGIHFMAKREHKNVLIHSFHLQRVDRVPGLSYHVLNIGETYVFVSDEFGEEYEFWGGGRTLVWRELYFGIFAGNFFRARDEVQDLHGERGRGW